MLLGNNWVKNEERLSRRFSPLFLVTRAVTEVIISLSDLCSLQILLVIRLTTWDTVPMISRFESEKYYKDPNKNNATYPFPIMEEEGSIDLSVIVPSYNEEQRCKFIIKLFICLAAHLNDATLKRLLSFIWSQKVRSQNIYSTWADPRFRTDCPFTS